MENILFLDTETEMVDFKTFKQDALAEDTQNWPRLLQLAFVVTDIKGNKIREYSSLIRPDFTIKERPEGFQNITQKRCEEEGIDVEEAIHTLFSELKKPNTILIGHNTEYDLKVCQAEAYRIFGDYPIFPQKNITDTKQMGRDILGIEGKSGFGPGLTHIYSELSGPMLEPQKHDAMEDVKMVMTCYFALCAITGIR